MINYTEEEVKLYNSQHTSSTVFLNRRARGPVPGPGMNYTGPREVLLEFLVF
jgi:hypothetical protein